MPGRPMSSVQAAAQALPLYGFRAIVRDGSHPWGTATIYGRIPGAHYSTVLFRGPLTDLFDKGVERVKPFMSDPFTVFARVEGGTHGLKIYAIDIVGGSFEVPIRSTP